MFVDKGKGEAYVWQKGMWNYVGEVTGADVGQIQGDKDYKGDAFFPKGNYDFMFDIQDESGGSRYLPYNRGDNPLVAAEKFLAREGLSVGYKEQIMNFIDEKIKGKSKVVP